MRLGGIQSRSGRGGEEKNSLPLPGLEPPIIQCYTTELTRLLPMSFQGIRPNPRTCVTFRKKLFPGGEEELLASRPTTKLEDHPLSAVRDCLFNIFAATFCIWRPSPPSATRGRAIPYDRKWLFLAIFFAYTRIRHIRPLWKQGARTRKEFNWIGTGFVVGFCIHNNEPSGCVTGGEILDQLSNYQSLKKDSAPRSWSVITRTTDKRTYIQYFGEKTSQIRL